MDTRRILRLKCIFSTNKHPLRPVRGPSDCGKADFRLRVGGFDPENIHRDAIECASEAALCGLCGRDSQPDPKPRQSGFPVTKVCNNAIESWQRAKCGTRCGARNDLICSYVELTVKRDR